MTKPATPKPISLLTVAQRRSVEARNRRFNAATPAQKRVMIAKDALLSLSSGVYTAMQGVYEGISLKAEVTKAAADRETDVNSLSVQEVLACGGAECQVCARGALFLSTISLVNKVKMGDTTRNDGYLSHSGGRGSSHLNPSLEFFSSGQINMIEHYFEGWCSYTWPDTEDWVHARPDPQDRLKDILTNIVKNKGTFRP